MATIALRTISTATKTWEPGDRISKSALKGEPTCPCHDSIYEHLAETGRIGSGS